MRRVVVDSGLILAWFTGAAGPARALRAEYERGDVTLVAPRMLVPEILEAVARATDWRAMRLTALADALDRLWLELRDPPSSDVAGHLARGIGAGDAAYAALASSLGIPLETQDEELLKSASAVARRA